LIAVCRLLELISSDTVSIELKVESVVILGSLAKGSEHVVQCVFDAGVMPLLLKGTVDLLCVSGNCLECTSFGVVTIDTAGYVLGRASVL